MAINRLFLVRPDQIVEHPTDCPVVAVEIQDGPLAGWECYAIGFERDDVVGPFDPVVGRARDGTPTITPPGTRYAFWYTDGTKEENFEPKGRPCWHQSSQTLRFIRKREA